MSVMHAVIALIDAVGESYGAIDIRSVAIRDGESWSNAMAVVRLTYEDVDSANARIHRLSQCSRPVKSNAIQICSGIRPFSEWESLCTELQEAVLRIDGLDLKLRKPIDLKKENGYLNFGISEIRPFDGREWPSIKVKLDLGGQSPLANNQLNQEVQLLGYSDPFEAANVLCELNVGLGQTNGADLFVSIPVFATISSLQVDLSEKSVDVVIERHKSFSDLNAMTWVRGHSTVVGAPFREHLEIPSFTTKAEGQIELAEGSVQFNELSTQDRLQVRLVHPKIGEIKREENSVRMFIPPTERNILLAAVNKFCDDAELDSLLTRPFEIKAPRLSESAMFELHVAWLLGMFGLSTVVLGEYEKLVSRNTRVVRTTLDILAVSQSRRLLVPVACTLNVPKAEDFGNLRYASDILSREVFGDTGVRVAPVLFTSATGTPAYDRPEDSVDAIPIIDGDQMKNVLKLLRVGGEAYFFEYVINPFIGRLPVITGD